MKAAQRRILRAQTRGKERVWVCLGASLRETLRTQSQEGEIDEGGDVDRVDRHAGQCAVLFLWRPARRLCIICWRLYCRQSVAGIDGDCYENRLQSCTIVG